MKKFKFRLQVVLDMRENELEQRQMEAARIMAKLREQEARREEIIQSQIRNDEQMENLYTLDSIDIQQLEGHRDYGLKLMVDVANQERVIANTKAILERKMVEVREAHKKVEILKKLKEKQEKQYYKEFLDSEMKELDDITRSEERR